MWRSILQCGRLAQQDPTSSKAESAGAPLDALVRLGALILSSFLLRKILKSGWMAKVI